MWFIIGAAIWFMGGLLMILAMARAISKQPPLPFSPLSQQEEEEKAS